MAPQLIEENMVRLWTRETVPGEDLYHLDLSARSKRQQLATWERPAVTGPTSANPEEIISGWAQDDWSGGFGIEDADEGTDTARFRFGVIDARSPHQVCLPPKLYSYAKPAGVSGPAIPIGDVGTQFYMAWGNKAVGFNESTQGWHSTVNNLVQTPLQEAVKFGLGTWLACGDSGSVAVEELTPNDGTLNILQVSPDQSTATTYGTWDNKLYGITSDNRIGFLSMYQATIDPATGWQGVTDRLGQWLYLNYGETVNKLINYWNKAGEPVLWAITESGAYMFDADEPAWHQASLEWGAHPEFGADAEVWRGGEDLFVAAGGLDVLRYTGADVQVPLSGPSKDQGVPSAYQGKIVALAAERSSLYCLVQVRAAAQTQQWTEDAPQSSYVGSSPIAFWIGAWTGTSWMCLAEVRGTSATPTKLVVSKVTAGYRLWWGDSDGVSYSLKIPLDFYNPRAKVELGEIEFESEGWWESIRYDANMVGWDKISSHCFAMMEYATADHYMEIEYRTDADLFQLSDDSPIIEPSYHPWKTVNKRGRTLLWFDDEEIDPISGEPWREGLTFQWIQFRFRMFRGSDTTKSPILGAFSMHHVRIPQDAASLTMQLKVPAAEYVDVSRPADTVTRLMALQRYTGFVHIQIDNETVFRGKLAGVTEERWMGGEQVDGIVTLIFVEVGAVTNAHQTVA